jgi:hypothetical protein
MSTLIHAKPQLSSFIPTFPPPPNKLPPTSVNDTPEPPRRSNNNRPKPHSYTSLHYFQPHPVGQQEEFLPVHLASISTQKLNRELSKNPNVLKLVLVQNMLQDIHFTWARNTAAKLSITQEYQYTHQEREESEHMDIEAMIFPPNLRMSSLTTADSLVDFSLEEEKSDAMEIDRDFDIQTQIDHVQKMQMCLQEEMKESLRASSEGAPLSPPDTAEIQVPRRGSSRETLVEKKKKKRNSASGEKKRVSLTPSHPSPPSEWGLEMESIFDSVMGK